MVSRNTIIKIVLVSLAVLVVLMPFILPTCRISKEQVHVSITSTKWIVGPEGGILTMNMTIENSAGCDANVESLQFRIYRLIYSNNTTENVDLVDAQVIHATIPAAGRLVMNAGFGQPFTIGPRAVMAKITFVFADGSSLEVFDGLIDTTGQQTTG